MKKYLSTIKDALKIVFSDKKYYLLSSLISIVIFLLFIFLNNTQLFLSALKIDIGAKVLFDILISATVMIAITTGFIYFSLIVLVSILSGIVISTLIYKINLVSSANKGVFVGFFGVFSGALSSGCTACSVTLISLLGVSGGLAVFPLKGAEFSILSILLLSISLYFNSKSIISKTCEVKK